MEAVLGLVVGLIIGGFVIWLWMKLRVSKGASNIESEATLSRQRLVDANRSNEELSKEAADWQNQAIEKRTEAAGLQAELNAANERLREASQSIEDLTKQLGESRNLTVQNGDERTRLRAELNAAGERLREANQSIEGLTKQFGESRNLAVQNGDERTRLQAELNAANKRLEEQTNIENMLRDQFKVLANEAMVSNSEAFLKTADEKIGGLVTQARRDFTLSKDAVQELVKPLSEELKRIENARTESQGSLKQQIEALAGNAQALQKETQNLSTALKRPEVRGNWGEIQLRRVVELAGMLNHCDFDEQVSVQSENGSRERPDMVVRMPNDRTIVVDAKTPMNAYIKAAESNSEEERQEAFKQHSQQVRERVRGLAQKSYFQSFEGAPDFVVMFLPGEFLLQPALEKDPELLDWAMQQSVVIATPNILMGLLKAVAMGWREARLAEDAAKVGELGQQLHDRIITFTNHMTRMRGSLSSAVEHFNGAIGSLESRVLPSARRFRELGISSSNEIPPIDGIDLQVRELKSPSDENGSLTAAGARGGDSD